MDLQVAEGKVSEGVNHLAEVRRQAGEEREKSSKALQAQHAATQAAQNQLQDAEVCDPPCTPLLVPPVLNRELE